MIYSPLSFVNNSIHQCRDEGISAHISMKTCAKLSNDSFIHLILTIAELFFTRRCLPRPNSSCAQLRNVVSSSRGDVDVTISIIGILRKNCSQFVILLSSPCSLLQRHFLLVTVTSLLQINKEKTECYKFLILK